MEGVLTQAVSETDLKRIEMKFNQELTQLHINEQTQFEYAHCLINSSFTTDVCKGIRLFEELRNKINEENNFNKDSDCLYFLAIGHIKVKQYAIAIDYCEKLLNLEPNNQKIIEIEHYARINIEKQNKESIAILSGATLVIGGLVSFCVALINK